MIITFKIIQPDETETDPDRMGSEESIYVPYGCEVEIKIKGGS